MMRRLISLAAAITLLLTLTLTAGAASELPQLHSEAALVVAPETGFVLYSKNDLAKRAPSSLVKIMTALVVLENADDLSASVTVSSDAVANLKGLATSSLKEGEVMTVTNLLYCLLLNSGADAANALAEYTAGSIPGLCHHDECSGGRAWHGGHPVCQPPWGGRRLSVHNGSRPRKTCGPQP